MRSSLNFLSSLSSELSLLVEELVKLEEEEEELEEEEEEEEELLLILVRGMLLNWINTGPRTQNLPAGHPFLIL